MHLICCDTKLLNIGMFNTRYNFPNSIPKLILYNFMSHIYFNTIKQKINKMQIKKRRQLPPLNFGVIPLNILSPYSHLIKTERFVKHLHLIKSGKSFTFKVSVFRGLSANELSVKVKLHYSVTLTHGNNL